MGHQFKRDSKSLIKLRVVATLGIWGIATGMLAVCIPLTAITKSGVILPLAVISGAAVGTVAVWRGADKQSINNRTVENNVKSLDQRVANLELIFSNEYLIYSDNFKHRNSKD